jgi:hypothetical protein
MSGCWLQVSNTREATTYSQWVAVGCKRFACGCKPEKHNSSNNLQPMSGCWLQVSNTREATTYSHRVAVGCKSKSTTRGRETLRHQWAVVNDREQAVR